MLKLGIDIKAVFDRVQETGRLMVGVPSYDRYVEHRKTTHPDLPVMSYREFFCERQDSRYGGGSSGNFKCC